MENHHTMKKHLLLILIGTLYLSDLASGQEKTAAERAEDLIFEAEEIMRATKALDQARTMYEFAAQEDPSNIKANYMAGEYYLRTVSKSRAVDFLLKVKELNENYRFDLNFKIGQAYQYGYDFENALIYYDLYKQRLTNEKGYRGQDKIPLAEVERKIFECRNGAEFKSNPTHYSIVSVGTRVNSESWDYGPVVNSDETLLIFTSRRQDGNVNENVDDDNFHFEDIFYSQKGPDGKWGSTKDMGENINTLYHESTLGLSPDGKKLFIYKDEGNGDIFESDFTSDGQWTVPKKLNSAINSESFAEKSASIDKNEALLFFSSNRPGGFGGLDIYVATKDTKGQWSKTINLGPMINTEFDDDAPFISYDGKTLYFSTKGRKGMGGYDIFSSEYDSVNATWLEPVNLGFPVNTPDDDIFFVATKDGKRGYYASVRDDGMGYTDIYMVTIPDLGKEDAELLAKKNADIKNKENTINTDVKGVDTKAIDTAAVVAENKETTLTPVTLMVRVEDARSGQLIDANMGLISAEDRITVVGTRLSKGIYEFKLNFKESKEFMLSAELDGYMFQNFKVPIPAAASQPREVKRRLEMKKLEKDASYILRNIYYEFDKAAFTTESYNELNKLEKLLFENPNLKIEIEGHTDNIGTSEYNKDLSEKRAKAVVQFLRNKGIDIRRLSAVGYGETRPIATNDDEKDGRELNRRVEFKILEK